MKILMLFAALTLSAQAYAADGTPINERRPMNAEGRITVSNISGLIEVKAWNKNEVEITGTLGEGSKKLEISGTADNLRVQVVLPERAKNVESSKLHLRVPEGARVELEGVSADLSLLGTRGAARLSTVSGNVMVEGTMRELRAESVSGDVHVKAPSADTRLESVSGDVEAEKITGQLRIETVSGDARVTGSGFSEVDVETVSGDMELKIDGLKDDAEISADSVSGNIRFTVAKTLNAHVQLETYSGELSSDFGTPNRDEPERLEATLGKGQGRFRAESHSGDIILKSR